MTLALLAGMLVAAALVSMVLMPIGVIGISPHQMRWLWPIPRWSCSRPGRPGGVATTATGGRPRRPGGHRPARRAQPAVVRRARGSDRRPAATGTAMALVDQLSSYRPGEPVLFDISVLRFAEPYSGPVLAALARDGVDVVVTDDGMVRQLGERRRAKGDERLRIELLEGQAAEQPPAGARRVAFVKGLDDAEAAELDRLATEVARTSRHATASGAPPWTARGPGGTDRRGRRRPRAGAPMPPRWRRAGSWPTWWRTATSCSTLSTAATLRRYAAVGSGATR